VKWRVGVAGLVILGTTLWGIGTFRHAPFGGRRQTWRPGVPAELLVSPPPATPETVSLLRLIADPTTFDGKAVRVVGFTHLEFEGDALYLHREDFEYALVTNSLALEVPTDPAFKALSDRYVIVEGIFKAPSPGYIHNRSGSIRMLSRFDPMPTHAELEPQNQTGR
jgi:hypothetical protein